MAMLQTDRIRLHVQRLAPPDGRPATATAVLLHGLLTDSLASYYFTVANGLAAAGLDVVMYDLRGHGRSERPATGYHLDAFVTDLEALLAGLGITGPVHLVGNSFGGTVAFGFADRHPERVAGLTVIESEPPPRPGRPSSAGSSGAPPPNWTGTRRTPWPGSAHTAARTPRGWPGRRPGWCVRPPSPRTSRPARC